jgi:acetylglutamate kinase
MNTPLEKARTIVEALPYINKFHSKTIVIKYGGSLIMDDEAKKSFCQDIALLKYVGINPIIIHGGGKEITKWMEKSGKQAVFIDGLRVTDSETMELTEMVLSGKINSDLVANINQYGAWAVGLSGRDGNLLSGMKRKSSSGQDLGLVGEVQIVNSDLLDTLSKQGYIPVISSVAADRDGSPLNINADEAAAAIAGAVKAEKLIFMTDVEGIKKENSLLQLLELQEAEKLMEHPDIKGGMKPKLAFSIQAIKQGVANVHIIHGGKEHAILLELLTDSGVGTMITHKRL